jgi:hypothetical protein
MATIVYESKNNALWLQRECYGNLEFLGCHDLTDLTRPQGEVTLSYQRSGKNQFDAVASKRAIPEPGTATATLYRQVVNLIDELPCPFSLLIYYSNCGVDEDPTNWRDRCWRGCTTRNQPAISQLFYIKTIASY